MENNVYKDNTYKINTSSEGVNRYPYSVSSSENESYNNIDLEILDFFKNYRNVKKDRSYNLGCGNSHHSCFFDENWLLK